MKRDEEGVEIYEPADDPSAFEPKEPADTPQDDFDE